MSNFPETRQSLVARIRASDDQDAWQEFVAIYRPVIYRLARQRGVQHADAEDLSQRVFLAVGRAIGNWKPDAERGRFRAWLGTIVRNAILNVLSRRRPDLAAGGSEMFDLLEQQPEPEERDRESLAREHRRSLFRWAARRVREEFGEETWSVFWQTAVEGRGIDDVAAQFGKTRGAIYAARSRIMRRLRDEIEAHTPDEDDSRSCGSE